MKLVIELDDETAKLLDTRAARFGQTAARFIRDGAEREAIAEREFSATPLPSVDMAQYQEAVTFARASFATPSGLSRAMGCGYNSAADVIERMELEGIVAPAEGFRRRAR